MSNAGLVAARPPNASDPREWPLSLAVGVAAFVLWVLIAWPLFQGQVYLAVDLWKEYLPIRHFYADCLARGDSFLWFPGVFGGYDLHGTGQASMLHPLHFLLYKFLPFFAAFDLEILLAYPFMFGGMFLFLRRWLSRTDCALFGALLFAFSTYNLTRLIHPGALQIIAHFPWVLYCADLMIRDPSRRKVLRAAVGFGLLNASELLLGYPQYVWFSCVGLGFYLLVLLVMGVVRVPRVALLLGTGILGVATGAVQLLPTMDSLALSVRTLSPDWTPDSATAGSIDPRYLTQAFSPYTMNVSHKQRIYFGAVPLLLAAWALVRRKQFGNATMLVTGVGIFAVLCVWLCLGSFGKLYYVETFLPFVKHFRYPSRYVHLLGLATSILGAFALQDMLTAHAAGQAPSRRSIGILCVPLLICGLVTAFALVKKTEQVAKDPRHVLIGAAIMALATGVVVATVWQRRAGLLAHVVLIALTAADLGYYGLPYSVFGKIGSLDQCLQLVDIPIPGSDKNFRILGGNSQVAGQNIDETVFFWDMDPITMLGWRRIDGFEGLPPFKRLDYRKLAARRVAGVKWVYKSSVELHGFTGKYAIYDAADVSGLTPTAYTNWFEVPRPLARARCVTRAVVATNPSEALDQTDVDSSALVEAKVPLEGGPPGQAKLLEDRPGRIGVRVQGAGRQLLVVSESYHPGWQIQIDGGAPAPALRVNGDFLGCVVAAGEHEVLLTFAPSSFRRGAWASAAGLLVLLAGAIGSFLIRD